MSVLNLDLKDVSIVKEKDSKGLTITSLPSSLIRFENWSVLYLARL